jgi:hypothetical protein
MRKRKVADDSSEGAPVNLPTISTQFLADQKIKWRAKRLANTTDNKIEAEGQLKKLKRQPAIARSLLPKESGAQTKEFTVEVSLIGRSLPGVRKLLDQVCRDFSQAAQLGSRLANFVMHTILSGCTIDSQQMQRLEKICLSWQNFHTECITTIVKDKAAKLIHQDELDAFKSILSKPLPVMAENDHLTDRSCGVLNRFSNQYGPTTGS